MIEINNKTRSKINLNVVNKVTEKFLKKYNKKNYNISIAFVGDVTIQKLNKQYRKKDKITDVLSFRTDPKDKEKYLGEIIIDYAQIKRQAHKFNLTIEKELIFILVHGLLHLVGYNDDTLEDAEEMDKLGNKFIKIL